MTGYTDVGGMPATVYTKTEGSLLSFSLTREECR